MGNIGRNVSVDIALDELRFSSQSRMLAQIRKPGVSLLQYIPQFVCQSVCVCGLLIYSLLANKNVIYHRKWKALSVNSDNHRGEFSALP